TRGDLAMNLDPTTTAIGITAYPTTSQEDYGFDCDVASSAGVPDSLRCRVYGFIQSTIEGGANFTSEQFSYGPAELRGHVCANGSFHFTTTVLDDGSSSLQNLVQVSLYGQLF